jgi:hypothetical protein
MAPMPPKFCARGKSCEKKGFCMMPALLVYEALSY